MDDTKGNIKENWKWIVFFILIIIALFIPFHLWTILIIFGLMFLFNI